MGGFEGLTAAGVEDCVKMEVVFPLRVVWWRLVGLILFACGNEGLIDEGRS